VLLALVALQDLELEQLDRELETAFLHGELEERSTCNNQKVL